MASISDYNRLVDAVINSYKTYLLGNYHMPRRMHVDYQQNTLLLMPAFSATAFSTKLVSVFPENKSKGKEVIQGVMVLNDGNTGEPLAIMNGAKLTALRTGAVGGAALRYLTNENTPNIGIVGFGVQGFHQAIFACNNHNIQQLYIFDPGVNEDSSNINKLRSGFPHVSIKLANTVDELVNNTQVIITTTTSFVPVLPETDYSGKRILAFGSYKPNMQEIPNAIFDAADTIFMDTEHAINESGDLLNPMKSGFLFEEQMLPFSRLIEEEFTLENDKLYIFKSVGMALFDLFVAQEIYDIAKENQLGQEIQL